MSSKWALPFFSYFRVKIISYNEKKYRKEIHTMDEVYYVNEYGVRLTQREYEDEIERKGN